MSLKYEVIKLSIMVDGNDVDNTASTLCCCKNGCREQCPNATMLIECIDCGSNECVNRCFINNDMNPDATVSTLTLKETRWTGLGVFTKVPRVSGTFIVEYVGEIVCISTMRTRLESYKKEGYKSFYHIKFFDSDCYIDATKKGNVSRFLNHSCEPNCQLLSWTVGTRLRAGLFAIGDIEADTELCIDYMWSKSEDVNVTGCLCHTEKCRGSLETTHKGVRVPLPTPKASILFCELTEAVTATASLSAAVNAAATTTTSSTIPNSATFNSSAAATSTATTENWRYPHELPDETFENDDREHIKGEWLVGKRVKAFWHGTNEYLEADVRSFQSDGSHVVCYLLEGSDQPERFELKISGMSKDIKKRKLESMDDPTTINDWMWLNDVA